MDKRAIYKNADILSFLLTLNKHCSICIAGANNVSLKYRNNSFDLQSQPIDWFLCERMIGR